MFYEFTDFSNFRFPENSDYFVFFSINRSFNLAVETLDEDILDEWLKIVKFLSESSYATLDEKLFTFILYGLNRGKLHLFWKSISSQGEGS